MRVAMSMERSVGGGLTARQVAVRREQQTAAVLSRMADRFEQGRWVRGKRFGAGGGNCLVGAIDEACGWTMPGVSDRVAQLLVAELEGQVPAVMLRLGRRAPRMVLPLYNDLVGGRQGALRLVRSALARLTDGGIRAVDAEVPAAREPVTV